MEAQIVLISDHGPKYTSSERFFERDFVHRTISPRYSKWNGKVESTVKIAKQLLRA